MSLVRFHLYTPTCLGIKGFVVIIIAIVVVIDLHITFAVHLRIIEGKILSQLSEMPQFVYA